jgi:hypothetical protein
MPITLYLLHTPPQHIKGTYETYSCTPASVIPINKQLLHVIKHGLPLSLQGGDIKSRHWDLGGPCSVRVFPCGPGLVARNMHTILLLYGTVEEVIQY